ncbi:hypothetical protein GCM10027046_30180 [Uliginosibacterium flavum]|uniref:Uncharacterized protein n=1 Tax=Uliginosibacterium flavum TaxID=1396831 RepID=A0ABV2TGC2_9RHOO
MKYFSRFILFLFCVLPLQAVFADEDYLIRAPEMIGFSPSIQIDQKGSSCDWIKLMFPHFLTLAEHGEVVIPASDPRATPYTLSIDFLSAEFEG